MQQELALFTTKKHTSRWVAVDAPISMHAYIFAQLLGLHFPFPVNHLLAALPGCQVVLCCQVELIFTRCTSLCPHPVIHLVAALPGCRVVLCMSLYPPPVVCRGSSWATMMTSFVAQCIPIRPLLSLDRCGVLTWDPAAYMSAIDEGQATLQPVPIRRSRLLGGMLLSHCNSYAVPCRLARIRASLSGTVSPAKR